MSAGHGTRTSGYLAQGSQPGGNWSAPVQRRWPAYVVAGPERHGVVRHALRTVEALHRIGVDVPLVRLDDAAHLRAWAAEGHGSGGPVHLDVTDALFAPTAAAAAVGANNASVTSRWTGPPLPWPSAAQARRCAASSRRTSGTSTPIRCSASTVRRAWRTTPCRSGPATT